MDVAWWMDGQLDDDEHYNNGRHHGRNDLGRGNKLVLYECSASIKCIGHSHSGSARCNDGQRVGVSKLVANLFDRCRQWSNFIHMDIAEWMDRFVDDNIRQRHCRICIGKYFRSGYEYVWQQHSENSGRYDDGSSVNARRY